MKLQRRSLAKRILPAAAALLGLALGCGAAAAEPAYVFLDNDFLGPGQSNIQSLIPLIRHKDVQILGIGVVTGDGWLKEEAAHVLRFLEIAGRADIPVSAGAETPLLRTPREMAAWEARYGRIPWKGAWNAAAPGQTYHPDDAALIPPLAEGEPTHRASGQSAAMALIAAVKAHPGQVTVIAAGPLTDIALALRLEPALPALAKEIVLQGGYLDSDLAQATQNTDYATDFNFLFDPEAAHMVLTAPWKRLTVVGDVTTDVRITQPMIDRIGAAGTPVARYLKQYDLPDQPFWDEIAAAVAVDRALVTRDLVVRMDVDLLPGPHYGRARIWNEASAPHMGEQAVHLVQAIDAPRFIAEFIAAASK